MNTSQLEEFLSTLPDPDIFADKNIYIWGIGGIANIYQEGLAREKSLSICGYTVSAGYEASKYTDPGEGGIVYWKRLFAPSEVAADKDAFVLVCAFNPEALEKISAELNSLNVKYCHIDAAIFGLHKDELRRIFAYLDDERSCEIYLSLLQHRTRGRYFIEDCASWDHSFVNHAFPEFKC